MKSFGVTTDTATAHRPWERGEAAQLLRYSDYPFYKIWDLARCWVFDTVQAEQLIVPASEVLRAWYLFDQGVMPAVLAGAIARVDSLKHALRPWLEGTGQVDGNPEIYQYVKPRWMTDRTAFRFARLVSDPLAAARAYGVHRQLAATQEGIRIGAPFPLPTLLPPYTGCVVQWTVTCQRVSAGADGKPRWLVLSLELAAVPVPFKKLSIVDELPPGQGDSDEARPGFVRTPRAPLDTSLGSGALITAAGPDKSIEAIDLEGFDFDDATFNDVTITRTAQRRQTKPVDHAPADPVALSGLSVDEAAPPRPGHARGRLGEASPEVLSPDDLLRHSVAALKLLVANQDPALRQPGWDARLHSNHPNETFVVRSKQLDRNRHFAILEVRVRSNTFYLLEAQRFPDRPSETPRLFICKSRSGYPFAPHVLESWLSRFPARKGNPWLCEPSMTAAMAYDDKRVLHQREQAGAQSAAAVKAFAQHLTHRLLEFISKQ